MGGFRIEIAKFGGNDGHEAHARIDGKSYADHPHTTWLGHLCFTEYITELKRAEEKLRDLLDETRAWTSVTVQDEILARIPIP